MKFHFPKYHIYECHWTSLTTSQHWFRQWLGAVRQQAINWANVDPDLSGHMVSLGHNELITSTFSWDTMDIFAFILLFHRYLCYSPETGRKLVAIIKLISVIISGHLVLREPDLQLSGHDLCSKMTSASTRTQWLLTTETSENGTDEGKYRFSYIFFRVVYGNLVMLYKVFFPIQVV